MSERVLSNRQDALDDFAAEREGIVEALRCVVGSEGAVYLATPITGGLRFLAWYGEEGHHLRGSLQYDNQRRAKVIVPNCQDAAAFAETLRDSTKKVVIDPSRFFLDHWTQPAYRTLWCEVVHQFATAMHFTDGWGCSIGCAQEFLAGVRAEIPLFEGLRNKLCIKVGLSRLRSGIQRLHMIGAPCDELATIVNDLEKLL